MLVTGTVQAEVYVDRAILLHNGADEAVAQKLARAVIAEADKSAWKVRRESVHIRRIDNPADDERHVKFVGIWSPRSARLVGGEYDGDTLDEVQRDESTGLPPEVLHLPYRDGDVLRTALDLPPLVRHPAYRRTGTHPIDDVWIYTHVR